MLQIFSGCATVPVPSHQVDIKKNMSLYFQKKAASAIKKNEQPCVSATDNLLMNFTTWKIVSQKCMSDLCEVKVVFTTPIIKPVMKNLMKESFLLAERQKGKESLQARTCEILAKKINSLKSKNLRFKEISRLFWIKYINGKWVVDTKKL